MNVIKNISKKYMLIILLANVQNIKSSTRELTTSVLLLLAGGTIGAIFTNLFKKDIAEKKAENFDAIQQIMNKKPDERDDAEKHMVLAILGKKE